MTLLLRLSGLAESPRCPQWLVLLDGWHQKPLCCCRDFNVHHNIPLDFFSEIAYTDSEETHVSVFRAEPLPVTGGGRLIFYIAAQRGQTRYAAQLYLH